MKKIYTCFLLLFLFAACKKEHKPVVVNYDISGTWALSSYQTNFGGGLNVSATQYSCLANNVTTFYKDATAILNYTGTDTCYVTPANGVGPPRTIGFPGLAPISSTWRINGNTVYITYPGNPKSIPGTISNANGKLQLTFRDTVVNAANIYYITTVDTKE